VFTAGSQRAHWFRGHGLWRYLMAKETDMDPEIADDSPPAAAPAARMDRRRALTLVAGAGLTTLVACGSSSNGGSSAASTSSTAGASGGSSTTTGEASCATIPSETAGPYPGDGSNGPNVLTEDGVVRRDIRSSFGTASGVADGIPLTIDLTILDGGNGCVPLPGSAVYLWHCDRDGLYSLYSQGATEQNYLRGVQEADGDGRLTFTSIFPAAYMGRWPHIHFEVYASLADATSAGTMLVTSQMALPEDVCEAVYATDGYAQSVSNMARTSLESDNVFSDGVSEQLATMTGSVEDGYVASLSVTV
jgi:protocatechuate 3,4-dioxygenase beta subunit